MSATMMNCNHYQSTPLSPPVTPKTWFSRGRSISPELQLPPIFAPSPPSTVVSDASKYCYKEQQQEMLDPILFTIPFTKKSRGGRSKSTPHRSPPASARGTFTLDIGQIIAAPMKQMKKRKSCTEETHDADANGVVSPNTILEQRHYKKQKTDAAAAYDKIDILIPDHEAFTDPAWIPNMAVFDEQPHVRVVWKGKKKKKKKIVYICLVHHINMYNFR
jgi:hypothetical protein